MSLRCCSCRIRLFKGDSAYLLEDDSFICDECKKQAHADDPLDRFDHGHLYIVGDDGAVTDPRLEVS